MVAVGPYGPAPVDPYLVRVGDIGVTQHWVVTPRGSAPLAGSEWFIVDRFAQTETIPVWAIILAIVLFPMGLLFLLIKEPQQKWWHEVTVRSGQIVHTVAVAARTPEAAGLHARVGYAQQLAQQTRVT